MQFRTSILLASLHYTVLTIVSFSVVESFSGRASFNPTNNDVENKSNIKKKNSCLSSTENKDNDSMTATSSSAAKLRSVTKVLPRPPAHWVGDGFRVYPVFADKAFTESMSPLLMFDYAEPKEFPPRPGKQPLGVGQHPHRGFETVTVAFQGEVEHHDSTGKSGIIKSGDVQWMTAGRGIIHQEYHSNDFTNEGGVFEMCQLWVNLPKKHKMAKPGYQGISKDDIPEVNLPLGAEGENVLGTARLIAGELGDTKGAAKTFSPVQMWDVNLPRDKVTVDIPYPSHHNCIVFVRKGSVDVVSDNDRSYKLGPQDVALTNINDGSDAVRIRVNEPHSSVMILGGEPLNEPIAARGPFVMNTQEQIYEAISDFQMGKMGR